MDSIVSLVRQLYAAIIIPCFFKQYYKGVLVLLLRLFEAENLKNMRIVCLLDIRLLRQIVSLFRIGLEDITLLPHGHLIQDQGITHHRVTYRNELKT